MLSKFTVPALCASLLLQGAAAASHHRHLHDLAKKDYFTDVVYVTEVVTKTVYEGEEEATPTPTPTPASVYVAKRPGRKSKSPAVVTTTSTSSVYVAPVVAPSSQGPLIPVPSIAPVLFATTMATAVITPVAEQPAPAVTQKKIEEVPAVVSSAAPVAAASPSAAAAAPGYSTGGAGKGRGLAYNDASLVSSAVAAGSGKFHWAYNWADVDLGLKADIPFVPTCWSPSKAGNWADRAAKAIAKGSDLLFGFNECDIAEQCNLSPAAAAEAHIQLMNPFQGKAQISAPSISSSWDKNKGTDWLGQFITACNGKCAIDVCNAHWYGPGGQDGATAFLTHLKNVHQVCQNKPVYVTEFKAEDSAANEAEFIKITLKELDTNPEYSFVHGYAYFFLANGFLATGNSLNSNGQLYATI